ncbi:hypothetical protein [Vibrio jasicida]|uniref:hypothetical protein n=1 Tax=Vibrio jasicida TaxID=766224 RepID=UPI0003A61B78|nr:hypothetical protein [Vibrio jasicida]
MYKIFNRFIVLGLSMFTSNVYSAFYISGEVKAGEVRWDNVTYGNDNSMVPSKWGVPPALRSVMSWSPGSLPAAAANQMILRGGLNGEVTSPISISVTGVQYNTTGIDYIEDINSINPSCPIDYVQLPIVSVGGIGCVSSTKLSTAVPTSPFVLFRPMFHIDGTVVASALAGKSEGTYTGSVPFTIRYHYENTSGVSTYRNISDVIVFNFIYEPVEVTNVVVLEGDGVMEPVYNAVNRSVSAQTNYRLEAQGYFNNGIVLTMHNQEYELVHNNSPEIIIPYNLTCPECSEQSLVSEGKLNHQMTYIGEESGIQTNLPFNLQFDYDVEGEPLVSGEYSDSITIMVSPRI